MLSYGLWQRKFGGDLAVIGKSLLMGNEPYTIVGVIGKQFVSDPEAEIWLPFQFPPVSSDMNNFFHVAGLLKPGVTLEQANTQLQLAAAQYHRDYPKQTGPRIRFQVQPLRDSIVGNVRNSLMILLGAVSLVLLIACANVANLLLARATARKREFAIRGALGASRWRVVRQLLIESALLTIAGGVLGLGLGFAGVRALLAISPPGLPRIGEGGTAVAVDWRVLTFTLVATLLTGILFGLFPALGASRTDLTSVMNAGGSRSGAGHRQGWARSLLVVMRSVLGPRSAHWLGASHPHISLALHAVDPGFDAHNVLTLEMSLNGERFQTDRGRGPAFARRPRTIECHAGSRDLGGRFLVTDLCCRCTAGFQIVGDPVDKDHQIRKQVDEYFARIP